MKLLIDNSPAKIARHSAVYDFIGGQLLTPLTRYSNAGGVFGIDNGAFSRFDRKGFMGLLEREKPNRQRCKFVAMPDVVGSARRTLEAFEFWADHITNWPLALVCQDGIEDLPIPWARLDAVFIGGSTDWKMSKAAADVIKAAQLMEVHTHVGRINTTKRWGPFESLGVDTCDGSGVSRFDWMLNEIRDFRQHGSATPLFGASDDEPVGCRCPPISSTPGHTSPVGSSGSAQQGRSPPAHGGSERPVEASLRNENKVA